MDPISDPAFPELKREAIARTGHFYFQDKDDMLAERLNRRLRAVGAPDIATYLVLLHDPLSGEDEWRALESELTIGETFFFRYAEQFQALREIILPQLLEAHADTRRLRIWSAGCATGAEAYSLAILLREALGEAFADWRLSIAGTDINEAFLETARRAQFTAWALRTLGPEERALYFEGGGNSFTLRQRYRSIVHFERHNLLTLLDGTSPLELDEFDLILCRNVLIYFHPETVNGVVAGLRDRLVPGGWLLLGHAEPNPLFAQMMEAVSLPGTVAYRRPDDGEGRDEAGGDSGSPRGADGLAALVPGPWTPLLPMPPEKRVTRIETAAPLPPPVPLPTAAPVRPPDEVQPDIAHDAFRQLANKGDFDALRRLCSGAMVQAPLDPVLHFYSALCHEAIGERQAAAADYRRALYLRRNFVMAHYHLGLLLLGLGEIAPGRRSIINAIEAAEALTPDTLLSEGGGMSASELVVVARLRLDPPVRPGSR